MRGEASEEARAPSSEGGRSASSAEVACAQSAGGGGAADAGGAAEADACAAGPGAPEAVTVAKAGTRVEARFEEATAPGGDRAKATPGAGGPATPAGGAGGAAAGRSSGALRKVTYARCGLRDLDAIELPQVSNRGSVTEVDFSQNCLTKLGVRQVVEFCSSCDRLEVLKLFRCGLPDEAAPAVAGFLLQHARVKAVHLSHNLFTATGAALLVGAAANAERGKGDVIWLRLERNSIASPASFLRSAEARWSVCPRSAGCTQHTCLFGNRVHLPFLDAERGDADVPSRWCRRGASRAQRGSAPAGALLAAGQPSWRPRALGSERA